MAFNPFYHRSRYALEGLIFNVLCGLYFLFLSPIITHAVLENRADSQKNAVLWLSLVLITISLLEVYALPLKMKFVRRAINRDETVFNAGVFLAWMMHAVISVLVTFSIFQTMGVELAGDDSMPKYVLFTVIAVVIKELYLLFSIMGFQKASELQAYQRPQKKEWFVDFILLLYACVVYSVTWEVLAQTTSVGKELVMQVVNYFVAAFLFILFYLPLRLPYHIEEQAQLSTDKDYFIYFTSLMMALIPALLALHP